MSLVHILLSPLAWLLLISFGLWLYVITRSGFYMRGPFWPLAVRIYFVCWLLFFFISTPAGASFLLKSLKIPQPSDPDFVPDYVIAFTLGYVSTGDPSTDYLSEESVVKIRTAVNFLKSYPDAKLLLLGGHPSADEGLSHRAQLMLDFTDTLRFPRERVLVISGFRRQHAVPIAIAEMEDVAIGARVALFAYDWEFRRLNRLFKRAFDSVQFHAVPDPEIRAAGVGWILPRESHLLQSGGFLREWMRLALSRFF